MRRLLVSALLAVPLVAQVPSWIFNPANGHYYALTSSMSWSQAEQLAQLHGGHLATVRSAAENAWLATTFANGAEALWIGLNDAQAEGTFVWTSGEPVTYTNWHPGEPSDYGFEDWVHMVLPWSATQPNALWNDAPNTSCYVPLCRGIIEVLQPGSPASYATFGLGCAGPTSLVPALDGVSGEPPRLGTTSRIQVSNLPLAVTVPIFVLGLSNTQDPGPPAYSLPLDLGIFGWPACSQLVSDDVISFAITTTGQADYSIAVPMSLGLVGFTFHAQALVLYSPSGVAVSNGVTGVVGY